MRSRSDWLIRLLLAGLALLSMASFLKMRSSRMAAAVAAQHLNRCQGLADHITRLRQQPSRAGLQTRSSTELATRLEAAAHSADISSDSMVRIDPQPGRRIDDSNYLHQPTSVELRLVTVKQLILFLSALTSGEFELQASSVRLFAPDKNSPAFSEGPEPAETWHAEVILTHLIFSPKSN